MSLFFRYIGFLYLKYFFFLFVSLECFFVVIDLVKYLDELPNSANLIVLLLVYDFMYASQFILPLSLILAQIVLMIVLLRNSQWTAFLALGYSKIKIFLPIFLLSFLMTFCFIALNATSFAYAKEQVDLIIDEGFLGNVKRDLFVKYNNTYIYFEKIFPLLQSAENVQIYEFNEDNSLILRMIESQKAVFNGEEWNLQNVTITNFDNVLQIGQNPLMIQNEESYTTLHGFKPKILENIYERKGNISIIDAYEAIMLLKEQGVNTQKIRGLFYNLIFFPLFAPLAMICLANFTPNSNRYANLSLVTLEMILAVLMSWGIFFSFSRLSISGLLQPELSILLPIFILCLVSFWALFKMIKA